jgi:hypothetical protein
MEPKKARGRRMALFAALIIFAALAAGVLVLIYTTKPVTDLKSAGVKANQLMASAGGTGKVCKEASEIFRRFGVSKQRFFSFSELKDYPAIAALCTPDMDRVCLYPGQPSYIAIRVGTHRDGFIIEIADTNCPGKYPASPGTLELVNSCVFVHR